MNHLINRLPNAIRPLALFTIFYYDVQPNYLTYLPIGAEFTTVFSPFHNQSWRAIRFRINGARRGDFQEVETRFLNSDEIVYFEGLIKGHEPAVSTVSGDRSAANAV